MRIKIENPTVVHFTTDMEVRVSDLNYGNHLGNDRFLTYAQEARVRFFQDMNLSEFDIGGTAIIQSDAAVVYKSEGKLGDRIRIEISITEISSSSFDIIYNLYNITTDRQLGMVKTAMVCYDYDQKKVMRVPESFKLRFA